VCSVDGGTLDMTSAAEGGDQVREYVVSIVYESVWVGGLCSVSERWREVCKYDIV
jgi:hypothetical protein